MILLVIKRLLVSTISISLGVLIMKYALTLYRWFGTQEGIEELLGGMGTVTLWRLLGLALVVFGILVLGGVFYFVGL